VRRALRDGRNGGLSGLRLRALGTRAKPLDSTRQGVSHLLTLAVRGRLGLLRTGLRRSRSPQLGHDTLHLRDKQLHPPIATAHVIELALSALTRGSLRVDLQTDLQGTALQLRKPYLQLSFSTSYSHLLGRRDLLVLGQLALDALQPLSQLTRMVLARAQTTREPVDLSATVVLEACATILGLDSQLLLGVLALLDTAQLVLTLGDRRLLDIESLSKEHTFLRGLPHPLLKAGQVSLERLHRRLGRLGAAGERVRRLGGLQINRAACAALREQIAVSRPRRLATRRL
jgi:hypothetical protein